MSEHSDPDFNEAVWFREEDFWDRVLFHEESFD